MTSWAWGGFCPFGIVAQPIKKIIKTEASTKRFNMAKPPHICIPFRVMIITARFIPKSNYGRIKRYNINFD
jgi:hypothetical protein